ncbi:cytoplasmic protein [Xenorhabdus khoisanae]|uniref:Cytoplasmic protein n=1 Tax=Xenorhabdus khoisanae TaxID=880157 RepID=A0A0J5FUX4_9GAMM|nr:cytoplasmic protein [Xenorhabdus khoisanae]
MKTLLEATVRVSGSGDSRQKAIADALNAVQRTVLQGSTHIILRIEPKDIAIISATSKVTTEKFLFFFLPRQREHYSVVLDVTVNVTLLDVQAIHFKPSISDNPCQPIRIMPQKNIIPAKHDGEKK